MTGCGNEHGLITVDQALDLILQETETLNVEQVPVLTALNRYLAEDIFSDIDLPMFSQSAVDGYAICADSSILKQSTFECIGEIRAGQPSNIQLTFGQAARIFTGAQIPKGTTTVARQEIVKIIDSSSILINETLSIHADIRDKGEEIAQGQLLATQGQHLSVGAIAALSMAGVKNVNIFRYPKIAVVVTGDEVAETIDDLDSGKIFDANTPLIKMWFRELGQDVDHYLVEDSKDAVTKLLTKLSQDYDVILTTGGISVGDYDFIRPAALSTGFEQIFWKIKQKPGKPMFFAKFTRKSHSPCYLLALPGNPAAVYVGMQIYVKTLLNALQSQQQLPNWFSAKLENSIKPDNRERFLRMYASFDQATLSVQSLSKQQSHMLSNLMQANCLVRIPAGRAYERGQIVKGIFI